MAEIESHFNDDDVEARLKLIEARFKATSIALPNHVIRAEIYKTDVAFLLNLIAHVKLRIKEK